MHCTVIDGSAKYCSLFFRPWPLLNGDVVVPSITLLGLTRARLTMVYEKTPEQPDKVRRPLGTVHEPTMETQVQWHEAWQEYIRGHIVSLSAADLIKSFLLHTLAASGSTNDHDNHSDREESEGEPGITLLELPHNTLQELIMLQLQELHHCIPPAQDETGRGSDVCSICAEEYLNLNNNPGMHRCAACLMEFETET